MKIVVNCAILFYMVQFFLSCYTPRTSNLGGVVVLKTRHFDKVKGDYVAITQYPDQKMWYKDSMIIQEVYHLYQDENINRATKWRAIIDRYKFIDLRRRKVYEYYTFSDTSKLIKKCLPSDTVCQRETWVLWTERHGFMQRGTQVSMTDTILNGVLYRRVKSVLYDNTEKGRIEFSTIGYFRCDLKNALLMFDQPFSRKIGCPLVRFEEVNNPPVYPDAYGELEYLTRKLTEKELKVFAAWEKRVDEYKTQD